MVKTFKQAHGQYSYIYHIHLFESDKGNRKAEYICDGEKYDINKKDGWLKTSDLYQMKIYRWLSGRKDPDIPAYDQTSEEDTANYLRGAV